MPTCCCQSGGVCEYHGGIGAIDGFSGWPNSLTDPTTPTPHSSLMQCDSTFRRQWGVWEMDLPSDDCCSGHPLSARSEWSNLYPPITLSAFRYPEATIEGIYDTAAGETYNERKLWGTFSCEVLGQPRDLGIVVYLMCQGEDVYEVEGFGITCNAATSAYAFGESCCRSEVLYIETTPALSGSVIGIVLEGDGGCGDILSQYSTFTQDGVIAGDPIEVNVGYLKDAGFFTDSLTIHVYADWNMDNWQNPNIGDTGDIKAYFGSTAINFTNGAGGSVCQIFTVGEHGLLDGDSVTISGSTTTPSINGTHTISSVGQFSFEITASVTVDGTGGTFTTGSDGGYSPSISTLTITPSTQLNLDTLFGAVSPLGFPTTPVGKIVVNADKTWSFASALTGCEVVKDVDELEIYFRNITLRSKIEFIGDTFGMVTPISASDNCGAEGYIEELNYRRFPHYEGDTTYKVKVREALTNSDWALSATIYLYADGGDSLSASSSVFVGNAIMTDEFTYTTTSQELSCSSNLIATITYAEDGHFTIS